jgi:hypothetical protein
MDRIERTEYEVVRVVNGEEQVWAKRVTPEDAVETVNELRGEGMKVPLGVRKAVVTIDRGPITWYSKHPPVKRTSRARS